MLAVAREDGEGEDVCGDEWQAVVRKEDVRATEKEKVVCGEGFRVGDVVRGVVVCGLSSSSLSLSLCLCLSSTVGELDTFEHIGGEGYVWELAYDNRWGYRSV